MRVDSLGVYPLRTCVAGLLLALLSGVSAAQDPRRVSGPRGIVSIEVPAGWRTELWTEGRYGELALFSEGELDIAIVVGCRPKRAEELDLEVTDLLDQMIESTMDLLDALGNSVVQAGKIPPLVEPWPAFGAVAVNADKTLLMTAVRSPIDPLICNITTLTANQQASGELMKTVSDVVGTARFELPDSAE